MIPGTTIALIFLSTAAGISAPLSLWWQSRPWRSVTTAEEERADALIRVHDELDDQPSLAGLQFLLQEIEETDHQRSLIPKEPHDQPSTGSSDGHSTTPTDVSSTVQDPIAALLRAASVLFESRDVDVSSPEVGPAKATKRLDDHNHMKLAKKLADECKLALTIRGYTVANDLVVEQWLKNALRQVPNRRNAHCLKIISLAKLLVFTPTSHDVETSALMNSRAFLDRRFKMDQTKHSRMGGLFGWFTGYRRVEGPSGSA